MAAGEGWLACDVTISLMSFCECFFFLMEEKERMTLLLCQAKGDHSRLGPQELCPPLMSLIHIRDPVDNHMGGPSGLNQQLLNIERTGRFLSPC